MEKKIEFFVAENFVNEILEEKVFLLTFELLSCCIVWAFGISLFSEIWKTGEGSADKNT